MSRVLSAIVLAALMGGCASAASSPPAESVSSSSASAAPSSSASAGPSAEESATPQEPSLTASAIALDRCTDGSGIYAVIYPNNWYSNGGGPGWDGWDACSLFGPGPFVDADDPAIAIRLLAQPMVPWSDPFAPLTGESEGYTVLRDEATTVGGRDAWVRV